MQLGSLTIATATAAPIFDRLAPFATAALVGFVVWKARKGAKAQVATAIAEARAQAESAAVASNTVMVNVGHGAGAVLAPDAVPSTDSAALPRGLASTAVETGYREVAALSSVAPPAALPVGHEGKQSQWA